MSYVATSPLETIKSRFTALGYRLKHYRGKNYYATHDPARDDVRASLLFGETPAGGVWFKDMAGISSPADVLRALGLAPSGASEGMPETLKPESREFAPARPRANRRRLRLDFSHPHATYNYTAASPGFAGQGQPSYQVRRVNFTRPDGKPDKEFRQYHWQDGRWQPGRGDTPELLYRLPEVVKAERILIVEGEKDADSLAALGYVATTHAGGAGNVDKALPAYREWLRGKRVVILPDNDDPGRKMAQALAAGLHGIAADIRIVDPGAWGDVKADVSDLIARRKAELLRNEEIRAEIDRILAQGRLWGPAQPGPKELERRAQRDKYRAEAQARPQPTTLTFEHALPPAELDKCELTLEHTVWASEGGRGQTFYYCNDPARCALCRERFTLKLGYYLEETARLAYVDADGNAAWSKPELTETGEFFSATQGAGQWYGKILNEGERRNFRARYKREKPGGFISPEVYAVPDGYEKKYVALSLAPFEDMQPIHLTDDLLQRIAVGVPRSRASLLFAPPRKQLERALPRYTFEIPQYLNERGIVATVPAAHSVLFTGPIKSEDIYSSFSTKAETFDDIGLILEEVGEKSINSDRLRGVDDHAPDYIIQSICIVPEAKPAYLAVWNAGRGADIATLEKFKRRGLPPLPTLQSERVVKGIWVTKLYIPLTTRQTVIRGEFGGLPAYKGRPHVPVSTSKMVWPEDD